MHHPEPSPLPYSALIINGIDEVCAMQLAVARVFVGSFMTSLNMAGFSLSLLLLDDARTAALDAPTQASTHFIT